jgi:uncharacterized delta-60 repeat protein
MRVMLLICLLASLAMAPGPAWADGERIVEFGTGGVAVFTPPIYGSEINTFANAEKVLVASDGAILALVGVTSTDLAHETSQGGYLIRFDANGMRDWEYGEPGYAITAVPAFQADEVQRPPSDVQLAPDGAAVLSGTTTYWFMSSEGVFGYTLIAYVMRYTRTGRRIDSFGYGGIYSTWEEVESKARPIALRPDGHVLFGGHFDFQDNRAYVRELRLDGTPDLQFASGGTLALPPSGPPDNNHSSTAAVALQEDGKILVGVREYDWPEGRYGTSVLYRLLPDGVLDAAFGDGGRLNLATLVGDASLAFEHLRVLSSGHILVGLQRAGVWWNDPGPLLLLDREGMPVAEFGDGDGVEDYPVNEWYSFYTLEVDTLGRILVADTVSAEIARLQPDGKLDGSFGQSGIVEFPELVKVQGLALAPSGAVVLAGQLSSAYVAENDIPEGSVGVIMLSGSAGPDMPLDTLHEGGFEP